MKCRKVRKSKRRKQRGNEEKMKKMLSVILVGILVFSMVGCGRNEEDSGRDGAAENENMASQEMAPENEADDSDQQESESGMTEQDSTDPGSSAADESETEPAEADGSNALVVYFSWSGNTENVANAIVEQTGADVFEIVPEEAYTSDYNTLLDIATEEKESGARPAIAGSIEDIARYDIIYVGYPNWWSDMPMILYTFFDSYDLSGKTIVPFCTSGGSGLSNTVNSIKELEPEADVLEGLHIGSSSSSDPENAVSDWLGSLGLAD